MWKLNEFLGVLTEKSLEGSTNPNRAFRNLWSRSSSSLLCPTHEAGRGDLQRWVYCSWFSRRALEGVFHFFGTLPRKIWLWKDHWDSQRSQSRDDLRNSWVHVILPGEFQTRVLLCQKKSRFYSHCLPMENINVLSWVEIISPRQVPGRKVSMIHLTCSSVTRHSWWQNPHISSNTIS